MKKEDYKEDILCSHCKKANLEYVLGYEPYCDDHLQCPICDSTYVLWHFEDYTVGTAGLTVNQLSSDSGGLTPSSSTNN